MQIIDSSIPEGNPQIVPLDNRPLIRDAREWIST